jgi:hypothetical protein
VDAEFHGVARACGVEDIQGTSRIRGCQAQRLETGNLRRLPNIKFFSLLLTDCSMVWYLRAIGNGSALALSSEIVDREDICGRLLETSDR